MSTYKVHLAYYGCARYTVFNRNGDAIMVRCMCGRLFPTTDAELAVIRKEIAREVSEAR